MSSSVYRGAKSIDNQAQGVQCSCFQSEPVFKSKRSTLRMQGRVQLHLAGVLSASRNPCHIWEHGWVALREVSKAEASPGVQELGQRVRTTN